MNASSIVGVNACRNIALLLVVGLWVAPVSAQDSDCLNCHEDVPLSSPAHPELSCADCHGEVTARHRRTGLEPVTDEVCGDCHRRPMREVGRSVHGDGAG
ncbi:MAG: cytochrome c3 family protein, partial [Gammaproteobacteria bacterium]|nr:cytochrome c3 family protein [Gammaproteobacteria bacterium]